MTDMNVQDPRDALRAEITALQTDRSVERAFLELAYTAGEAGIIPFSIRGDVSKELIALTTLAIKFKDGVPDWLRM